MKRPTPPGQVAPVVTLPIPRRRARRECQRIKVLDRSDGSLELVEDVGGQRRTVGKVRDSSK